MLTLIAKLCILALLLLVSAMVEKAWRNPTCARCGARRWYKSLLSDWECQTCGHMHDLVEVEA